MGNSNCTPRRRKWGKRKRERKEQRKIGKSNHTLTFTLTQKPEKTRFVTSHHEGGEHTKSRA